MHLDILLINVNAARSRPAGFLSPSGPDTEELSIKDSRIDLNLYSQPEDMLSMLSSQSHADQAGGPGGEAQGAVSKVGTLCPSLVWNHFCHLAA